jgi:hypothetical protein
MPSYLVEPEVTAMHPTTSVVLFLARDRRRNDWQAADAWRRLHAATDAQPMPWRPDRQGIAHRIVARVRSLSMGAQDGTEAGGAISTSRTHVSE